MHHAYWREPFYAGCLVQPIRQSWRNAAETEVHIQLIQFHLTTRYLPFGVYFIRLFKNPIMKKLTTITLLLITLSCSAQSFRLIGSTDKVYLTKSLNSWKVQRDTVILFFGDLQTAAEAMAELTRSKSYYVTLDEEIIVNVMYHKKTCMYHIRLDGYPEAGVISDHARILLTAKGVTDALSYTRSDTNQIINP